MDQQITTRAERAATTATAEPETKLTLSELQGLLREAAALERAQRPIILHTAPMPVPAVTVLPTQAGYAPRHPGLDITIPPSSVGWAPVRHRAPQRPGWGVRLAYSGMLSTLAGAAGAGATDGNSGAVAVAAAGLLATIGGIAQAVNEHGKEA